MFPILGIPRIPRIPGPQSFLLREYPRLLRRPTPNPSWVSPLINNRRPGVGGEVMSGEGQRSRRRRRGQRKRRGEAVEGGVGEGQEEGGAKRQHKGRSGKDKEEGGEELPGE